MALCTPNFRNPDHCCCVALQEQASSHTWFLRFDWSFMESLTVEVHHGGLFVFILLIDFVVVAVHSRTRENCPCVDHFIWNRFGVCLSLLLLSSREDNSGLVGMRSVSSSTQCRTTKDVKGGMRDCEQSKFEQSKLNSESNCFDRDKVCPNIEFVCLFVLPVFSTEVNKKEF